MTDSKFIQWEKDGYLGILILNNPPENYLINPELIEIQQLKIRLADDIRALIITGTGRHFSAGADIQSLISQSSQPEELKHSMMKGNQLLKYISQLEIPVLAAISGVCFGGGLEIALAADIRICTNRSLFAFPEIHHELIPGLGGVKRLKKICGQKTALEILLSGDIINAGKALELKIVDQVIQTNDCLDFSKQFMNGLIRDRSPKVIQYLMRSFRNAESVETSEAMFKDVEMFCELAHDFSAKS